MKFVKIMSSNKQQKSATSSPAREELVTRVSRPRRKPDASVKGKLNRWEGSDYCEFVPTGTRESNRTMFKQVGGSSFYKSEGQKESSYTIHLNVDGSSEDPVNEAFELFKLLTEGQRKQQPKLNADSEGRMLLDNGESLKIWLDHTTNKVSILTTLECNPDIERQLLQAQAQMNVTLGRYRSEIIHKRIEPIV
jgi:hypothetical protein